MSGEKNQRRKVIKALRRLDAYPIENTVGVGTPDVNYVGGWIELKSCDEWPKKPLTPLRIDHFTTDQRLWLEKRWRAGGACFLLLKVAQDWLLFAGPVAAEFVGHVDKETLFHKALHVWQVGVHLKGSEVGPRLLKCLSEHDHREL